MTESASELIDARIRELDDWPATGWIDKPIDLVAWLPDARA